MKTQKGYFVIILIPMITTMLLVVAGLFKIADYYRKTKNSCRHHLLRAQEHFSLAMNELIRLNPDADSLRQQEVQARLQMSATAAFPPAYAAAVANYNRIKLQQYELHQRQLSILRSPEQKVFHELTSARKEIQFIHSVHSSQSLNLRLPTSKRLAVEARPSGIAPSYYPQSNFSEKQKITARWSSKVESLMPQFFKHLFNDHELFVLTCSSTIERRNNKWQSLLVADKF